MRYRVYPSIVLFFLLSGSTFGQSFKFTETEEGIALTESTRPVYFYQKITKSLNDQYPRANYLHPLYGLNDEVLTEDFPADHLHHRGIFWAWHQIIVGGQSIGDGWECKGIEWKVTNTSTDVNSKAARLEVSVDWNGQVGGKNTSFIKEHTVITAYPTTADSRELEFEINLTAPTHDVWLGGSEDHKGYSGFSARVKLPDDITFHSEKGKLTPVEPAIKAGGWVDMLGTFGKNKSGLTIMADTTTMSSWHGWILRSENSMQNAAFPGREPVKIGKGETLRMRYKIVVHSTALTNEQISTTYQNFINNQ